MLIPINARTKTIITHVCHVIFKKKEVIVEDDDDWEELKEPGPSGKGVNVGKSSGKISVIDLIYSCVLIILKIHINFSYIKFIDYKLLIINY